VRPQLAGEVDAATGFGHNVVRGELGDALVDLAEECLVCGEPFLPSSHRTIVGHSQLGLEDLSANETRANCSAL
jgi:hypothetical protein